jgi:hypothetical protein
MSSEAGAHAEGRGPAWAELSVERVLAAYGDGVRSLSRLGAKVVDWRVRTPCPDWTLLDLAGHVLSIARYHHRLLNAALAGRPLQDLPRGAALAVCNDLELRSLPEPAGPERFLAFEAVALRYGERLEEVDWSLPVGVWSGIGALSVGDHALTAVGEWHLHAWDTARSFGWDYRPDDPAVVAAGRRIWTSDPVAGDPWTASLVAAGRRP